MKESELVFSELLGCQRVSLYLNKEDILGKEKSQEVVAILKRRLQGEPIQYILGKADFMGLSFKVDPAVLIPRPETEILVESVLNKIAAANLKSPKILDVGTGSGCISVSLAKLILDGEIHAIDFSPNALEIAKFNALAHCVANKITFIESDLFSNRMALADNYDIIISNPPYIASGEIKGLQAEVQYEPRLALDGGVDGLDFYRKIIKQAPTYLTGQGFIFMEIGFSQSQEISKLIFQADDLEIVEIIKDYNNLDRVIVAKKKRV